MQNIHVINGLRGTIRTFPARGHPERVMDARTNSKTCADIATDVYDMNDVDVQIKRMVRWCGGVVL